MRGFLPLLMVAGATLGLPLASAFPAASDASSVAVAAGGRASWLAKSAPPEAVGERRASGLPRDTVLPVRPGDTFESETLRGTLIVRAGGDEVRMSGSSEEMPRLVREGRRVRLEAGRGAREQDVLLEVPSWMPITIRSRELDVAVSELEGEVRIEILRGDVRIQDVSAPVDIRTVDGEVEVRGTTGVMSVFTADGDVRVIGHRGRLQVESTDGDVTLRDIQGEAVTASTLDGDVEFDGAVTERGFLELSTHDGDLDVALPASVEADVEVTTFHGGFSSEFRVLTGGFRAGEPLRFQIGEGGARIALRSFDGDISILSR